MAELIKTTDSLNDGRKKLNDAITDSNAALSTANTAKQTANLAKAESESTQTQLDNIVIEGDSSVEAAQARVNNSGTAFPTLKQRLDAENQEVTAQLQQRAHYVTANGVDDTDQVVNAWKKHQNVIFKSGTYVIDVMKMWTNRQVDSIPSDRTLTWEEGAVWTVKSNAYGASTPSISDFHCFMYIKNENITLNKPVLIGDIDFHTSWETSNLQHQGFGIILAHTAKNIKILYPNVSKMLADGLFLNGENIIVESPLIDKNRRNGIVIESIENLTINNPIITNSGSGTGTGRGIGPGAGIDIEGRPGSNIKNVIINNPVFKNNLNKDASNGAGTASSWGEDFGLILSGRAMTGEIVDFDVTINNPILYNSGIAVSMPLIPSRGRVRLVNPQIFNVTGSGIFGHNEPDNSSSVEIINPIIENWNVDNKMASIYKAGIAFSKDNVYTKAGLGNIKIINPTLKNDDASDYGILLQDLSAADATGTKGLRNVHLVNPIVEGVDRALTIDTNRDASFILQGGNQVKKVVTTNDQLMTSLIGFLTYEVNAPTLDVILRFSIETGASGEEYTIRNDDSNSLKFLFVTYTGVTNAARGVIPNYETPIYGLRTTENGASLTFRRTKKDSITIVNMIGTWEPLTVAQ